MSPTIRPARPDEFETVDRLIEAAYAFDYGPREKAVEEQSFYRSASRSAEFEVLVAVDEKSGALCGSVTTRKAGGAPLMADARADELDFRLLAIAPEARKRGIGQALVAHLIEIARDRGFGAVFMKSAPEMVKAHNLYFKLGFTRDFARDGLFIGGRKQIDLHAFRKAIAPRAATPETSKDTP
ncbi:N-acetyltransferase [Kaistia sp. 32K]|uniref:GNAT family N-acetyltransferase n=1 Tax=Kaistia sp. 32K TaxID=2795690 RepID=UPI001916BAED|nr:GNAT family N-acetyltransferase [Kaistia sp. 32K]BCP52240.1 N-acetyltransferase [Kaistia sp. 32K]